MVRTAICLMVVALTVGLTTGCGQKGPLERPPAAPAVAETLADDRTETP